MLEMQGADKGFEFCTGGLNPLAYNKKLKQVIIPETLTGTAQQLSEVLEKYLNSQDEYKSHIVGGLSEAGFAFGDRSLFEGFGKMANEILQKPCLGAFDEPDIATSHRRRLALGKLEYLTNHPECRPPRPDATRFDLKNEFYRTPQWIAAALSQWYDIDAVSTDDQITKLAARNLISTSTRQNLKKAMEMPLVMRFKTHSKTGEEWEGVRAKDHDYKEIKVPDAKSVQKEKHRKWQEDHVKKFNEKLPQMKEKDVELTSAELTQLREHAVVVHKLWNLAKQFYDMRKPGLHNYTDGTPRCRNPFMAEPF